MNKDRTGEPECSEIIISTAVFLMCFLDTTFISVFGLVRELREVLFISRFFWGV